MLGFLVLLFWAGPLLWGSIGALLRQIAITAGLECSYWLNFVLGEVLPDNRVGPVQQEFGLDSSNFL
jgi:hypothetical protein